MLLNRDRADEIMDREGLDALVAVTSNNVFYLSDYQSDFLYDVPWVACAILPRSRDIAPCLCVTEIEAAVLLEEPSWMPDVRFYYFGLFGGILPVHTFAEEGLSEDDKAIQEMVRGLQARPYVGVTQAVSAAIKDMGLSGARIGFDDTRFAPAIADAFHGEVHDATNLLLEIRMVKTPDEIAILREAAHRNERAMRHAFGAITPGTTWEAINRAYEVAVAQEGGRVYASFNGGGRKSAGAGRPHQAYPIELGDQVCFDSMMKWNRYMGDAQRTVILGEASPKLERYWAAYKKGIDAAYGALKPGVQTGALRDLCIDTVRKNGLPSFELAFSHGIGLDHIEVPFIAGGTLGDFTVEENMVLNIDMELHEIGWGGVFFEETMLITKNGAERLYDLPRELIRL